MATDSIPEGPVMEPMLLTVFFDNLDPRMECTFQKFVAATKLEEHKLERNGCHLEGPGQSGEMGCQQSHEEQ